MNIGDSRSIMSKAGEVLLCSIDHKPENEVDRIKQAGGSVNGGRINGMISVSRAIGDFDFKKGKNHLVSNEADFEGETLEKGKDEFILMGCDGVFEI